MANYRTGTIAVTNGSKAVVGTDTDFINAGIMPGDEIQLTDSNSLGTGPIYEVAAVTDATHLTLLQSYQGTTASALAYVLRFTRATTGMEYTAQRLARTMNLFQATKDAVSASAKASGIPQADSAGKISLGYIPPAYGVCATASATVAKAVSISNFVLTTGARIQVEFANGSGIASPTLNVNGTGAKAITYKGAVYNTIEANAVYPMTYDGTNWEVDVQGITAAKNVYVSSSGSNSTGDGTSAAPWATIQHAVDMCPNNNNYMYTISLLDSGPFAGFLIAEKRIMLTAASDVAPTISSAVTTTRDNTLLTIATTLPTTISVSSGNALSATYGANVKYDDLALTTATVGNGSGIRIDSASAVLSRTLTGSLNITNFSTAISVGASSLFVGAKTLSGSGNTSGVVSYGLTYLQYALSSGFATTLYAAYLSGRIYAGPQSSVPNY